jgi:capsular polysaccharide biosynthesis protein
MEDTLGLTDVLGILRRRFWIVLLIVFVAVSVTALLSYVVLPPVYQADTSLIVNEHPGVVQGTGVDYGQIETNRSLAVTYARIITSRAILQDTIDTLKLPETVKQLTVMTSVQVQGQTEIIAVRVTDKSSTEPFP